MSSVAHKKKGCRIPTASTNRVEAERRDIQLSTLRRQGSTRSTAGGRHHHGTCSSQQAHGRGREKPTGGNWGNLACVRALFILPGGGCAIGSFVDCFGVGSGGLTTPALVRL
ncbi:hypothetical protein BDZ89DRAFT_204648 [Hymenopellis radicata]|nr:hypothetical protein BDZ89DRAFT_204648 [Hymenopellis radicata]